jgi:hypothetical protein
MQGARHVRPRAQFINTKQKDMKFDECLLNPFGTVLKSRMEKPSDTKDYDDMGQIVVLRKEFYV